jgi:uncharacterized membrane protein
VRAKGAYRGGGLSGAHPEEPTAQNIRYAPAVDRLRRRAPDALAALLATSGLFHLVRPDWYGALVPPPLPAGPVIAISGLAELACAVGLLTRRGWAGPASALLLVAILPGNVWFAIDRTTDPTASTALVVGAWLRLPLQLPMIWAALQARTAGPTR